MPTSRSRLAPIDFLRGIAILLVLGRHHPISPETGNWWSYPAVVWHHWGWTGVDLFFVLSGFLVSGLLFREHLGAGQIRIRPFLMRRAFKIWPSYYLYLAGLAGFLWYDGQSDAWRYVLPAILNVQNYFEPIRIHLWSLAVEEHFYLVPILLVALMKWGRLRYLPGIVLCLVVACTAGRTWLRWQDAGSLLPLYATHLRLDGLAVGVLLAYLKYVKPAIWLALEARRTGLLAGGLILVVLGGFPNLDTVPAVLFGLPALYTGYAGILVAFVAANADSAPRIASIVNSAPGRWITWTGMYSFSIYLWHNELGVRPVHRLEVWLSGMLGTSFLWPVATLLYVLIAILTGVAIGKLVEQPVLVLREIWIPAAQPAPQAKAARA